MVLARRRSAFAETLSAIVRRAGASPNHYGSVFAWMRRAFFGARVTVLGGHHLGDSLDACERQQTRTAGGYQRALKRTWPAEDEAVLRSRFAEILDACARVRVLHGNV